MKIRVEFVDCLCATTSVSHSIINASAPSVGRVCSTSLSSSRDYLCYACRLVAVYFVSRSFMIIDTFICFYWLLEVCFAGFCQHVNM
jgi:hypothetical protein